MTGDVVVKGRTLDVSVDPAAHRPSRLARYRAGVDEPCGGPPWPAELIQRHRLGRCHRLGRLQQDVPRQESGRDIWRRYRR